MLMLVGSTRPRSVGSGADLVGQFADRRLVIDKALALATIPNALTVFDEQKHDSIGAIDKLGEILALAGEVSDTSKAACPPD